MGTTNADCYVHIFRDPSLDGAPVPLGWDDWAEPGGVHAYRVVSVGYADVVGTTVRSVWSPSTEANLTSQFNGWQSQCAAKPPVLVSALDWNGSETYVAPTVLTRTQNFVGGLGGVEAVAVGGAALCAALALVLGYKFVARWLGRVSRASGGRA